MEELVWSHSGQWQSEMSIVLCAPLSFSIFQQHYPYISHLDPILYFAEWLKVGPRAYDNSVILWPSLIDWKKHCKIKIFKWRLLMQSVKALNVLALRMYTIQKEPYNSSLIRRKTLVTAALLVEFIPYAILFFCKDRILRYWFYPIRWQKRWNGHQDLAASTDQLTRCWVCYRDILGSYHPDHRIALPPVSTLDDISKGEIQMWMLDFYKVVQVDLSDPRHGSAKDRFMILVEVHHAADAFRTSFKQTASRRPAVPFLNNLASLTI